MWEEGLEGISMCFGRGVDDDGVHRTAAGFVTGIL